MMKNIVMDPPSIQDDVGKSKSTKEIWCLFITNEIVATELVIAHKFIGIAFTISKLRPEGCTCLITHLNTLMN